MRHSPTRFIITALWISCALAAPVASAADDLDPFIGADALKKITVALPSSAAAKPARPRKVLVFTESARDLAAAAKQSGMKFVPHPSAPHCAKAVALMGPKTGAYEATISSDPRVFSAEKLKAFDAIVLANVYLEGKVYRVPRDLKEADKPTYEARQKALLEFIRAGKGIVGIHNAACTALAWPEYNRMIGGTHHGHAWHAHQAVPIRLDDAGHPLNAAFGGKGFSIRDDIYTFTSPYSRESVHVLLSVDAPKAPESITAERADGDYPVSWVKGFGRGRVFYTALGHNPATFQDAKFLRHLLGGIQFALGDLRADAKGGKALPAKAKFTTMKGWTTLFDGKDLSAWAISEKQKPHWVVVDGIIRYDGRGGSLRTKQSYSDYMLRVDWRLPRKADSGVFVRGSKQLNIWTWSMGSGEMWEHRGGFKGPGPNPYVPSSRQDRAVGEWNIFLITVRNNRVTVLLNGTEVISNAVLKDKPQSPIGLQQHGDPIEFKSIYIKPVPAAPK